MIRNPLHRLFGGAATDAKLAAAIAEPITLRPIGVVLNSVHEPRNDGWDRVVSDVRLRDDLTPALLGLNGYSHVIVLFYLNAVPEERRGTPSQIRPRGDERYPLQGVLATRTQHRPIPIGMAVVAILEVEGALLRVRGLDAIDGTPVLDLKPYIPYYDAVADAGVPGWVMGEEGS